MKSKVEQLIEALKRETGFEMDEIHQKQSAPITTAPEHAFFDAMYVVLEQLLRDLEKAEAKIKATGLPIAPPTFSQ